MVSMRRTANTDGKLRGKSSEEMRLGDDPGRDRSADRRGLTAKTADLVGALAAVEIAAFLTENRHAEDRDIASDAAPSGDALDGGSTSSAESVGTRTAGPGEGGSHNPIDKPVLLDLARDSSSDVGNHETHFTDGHVSFESIGTQANVQARDVETAKGSVLVDSAVEHHHSSIGSSEVPVAELPVVDRVDALSIPITHIPDHGHADFGNSAIPATYNGAGELVPALPTSSVSLTFTDSTGTLALAGGKQTSGSTSGATSTSGGSAVLSPGTSASGLIINVNYDSSASSAPAGFTSVVSSVVQWFESHFNDPITVTIDVGFGEVDGQSLGSGALGSSLYFLNSFSFSQVASALQTDAKSANDSTAVGTLPGSNPTGSGTFWVTTAESKALGLQANGTSVDGYVGFNSTSNIFDYDNSNGVTAGQYDFFGVVAHEISEVMGRELMVGENFSLTTAYSPLDLFHYSAAGVRDFSGTQAGYFSFDGGTTNLANFNTNTGGDFGDWASSVGPDAALAFGSPGSLAPISAADIAAMDVIGWDLVASSAVTVAIANDTGSSSSDKITTNAALVGTASANATVTLTEGSVTLGTTTADASGVWSFTPSGLSDGAHTIVASVTGASASLTFTLDTVAPSAPTIAAFSPDSGTAGDHLTDANTLTLSGSAEANSTVKVFDGATLLGTATANGTGAWTFATAALTNGAHSFTATATDAAGNTSAASAALAVTVDTVSPVAPTITSFSPDSGTAGDHLTNASTLTLSGSAEANSTVKVFAGATLLGTATANGTGAWTFATAALTNGAHSFTATATDAAGNTGAASGALAVTIDTVAPSAPTIAAFSPDSGTAGDHLTDANTLTLSGSAEANSTVKVFDGATLLGTATANGTGAWTFATAALTNGAHSFTATATDAAGNTGAASGALAVTID